MEPTLATNASEIKRDWIAMWQILVQLWPGLSGHQKDISSVLLETYALSGSERHQLCPFEDMGSV